MKQKRGGDGNDICKGRVKEWILNIVWILSSLCFPRRGPKTGTQIQVKMFYFRRWS